MPTPDVLDDMSRGQLAEVDPELVDNIETLVEDGQRGMVLNLVTDLYPADVAQVLSHLPLAKAKRVFQWLSIEQGGEVLPELDDDFRAALLDGFVATRLTALLDEMDSDDAADVLADLPDDVAQEVLPTLEDAEDVKHLLRYDEDTAGGIMAREYVIVSPVATVAEATEIVRHLAEEVEKVYVVYAVNQEGTLEGVVSLKKLLLSGAGATIGSIMDPDVKSVTTDVDQEEVARIMERYDLDVLPVVDDVGRLQGRITIDDVIDVIREEAEEDIQRMSGVTQDEEPTASVWQIIRGRITWLYLGLGGALLSGTVIMGFESALEENIVLAFFIPVVMAMAGNAGIQSSAVAVQGLASGDLWTSDVFSRLGKELLVSVLNGLLLAVVLGVVVVVLLQIGVITTNDSVERLSMMVSLSLIIVIVLSTTIGATIPLLLDRIGIDPALATGPFITTSNDLLGLAIFFLMASILL